MTAAARPATSPAFRLPIRVYYEDTDAIGVVYYANYLKFCERARTEWLRAYGFDQQRLMAQQGLAFVVRSVQADFLAGAELDDQLEVLTHIERLGGASVVFRQQVLRGEDLLFSAAVVVACIDRAAKKPAPIPKDIRARLSGKPLDERA